MHAAVFAGPSNKTSGGILAVHADLSVGLLLSYTMYVVVQQLSKWKPTRHDLRGRTKSYGTMPGLF